MGAERSSARSRNRRRSWAFAATTIVDTLIATAPTAPTAIGHSIPQGPLSMVLGIDHRANDGAGGATFLRDVRAWLEAVGPEIAIY